MTGRAGRNTEPHQNCSRSTPGQIGIELEPRCFFRTGPFRALAKARTCAYPKALAFFELMWTVDAPAVHELTCDWQEPRSDEFRLGICGTFPRCYYRFAGNQTSPLGG